MHHELIGYLFDALEDDEVTRVDDVLQTCGDTRRQLEVLRCGLEPVDALRDEIVAPEGLSLRTCRKIRETMGPEHES